MRVLVGQCFDLGQEAPVKGVHEMTPEEIVALSLKYDVQLLEYGGELRVLLDKKGQRHRQR